jgi:cobalt/nickel transport system permease protein
MERFALAGIFSAISFVLQMFNIPLPGGTTAHVVGTGAIAIILGPWLSFVAISVVLTIQALLFADGGVTAIGANSFNMGFLFSITSFFIFSAFKNSNPRTKLLGAFLAGYAGIAIAALATAIEIGIQPIIEVKPDGTPLYSPFPLKVSIPAMMIPHLLIVGVIEGLFTLFIIDYFRRNFPEVLK